MPQVVQRDYPLRMTASWDERARLAVQQFAAVDQPLAAFIDGEALAVIYRCLETGRHYRSFSVLRQNPHHARVMNIGEGGAGA